MTEMISETDRVVDLRAYRQRVAIAARRVCRHCGAALADGEADDDCSANVRDTIAPLRRRAFRAD